MIDHQAFVVVDLGFGDAGKGSIVDFLCRERAVSAVVRFNGGAQAGHNVITPDGRHHTFSQFGSGSFVPGVRTHLTKDVLFDPIALENEASHLHALGCNDVFARLSVDPGARVVTPFHKAANRFREVLRGLSNHGSCGMGVGETVADSIVFPFDTMYALDLHKPDALCEKLKRIQRRKREEFADQIVALARFAPLQDEVRLLMDSRAPSMIAEIYWRIAKKISLESCGYLRRISTMGDLVFEGAQGVLLDEWYGFHPYTTWSTTTQRNARQALEEAQYPGAVTTIGVLRAYHTRHGVGPFPTEEPALNGRLSDPHNNLHSWQGAFRIGWFDEVLAKYAIDVAGEVNELALTHLDRMEYVSHPQVCVAYANDDCDGASPQKILSLQKKGREEDLRYQEQLTALLQSVKPVYEDAQGGEQYIVDREKALGVPVTILSYGNTAGHKKRRAAALTRQNAA